MGKNGNELLTVLGAQSGEERRERLLAEPAGPAGGEGPPLFPAAPAPQAAGQVRGRKKRGPGEGHPQAGFPEVSRLRHDGESLPAAWTQPHQWEESWAKPFSFLFPFLLLVPAGAGDRHRMSASDMAQAEPMADICVVPRADGPQLPDLREPCLPGGPRRTGPRGFCSIQSVTQSSMQSR